MIKFCSKFQIQILFTILQFFLCDPRKGVKWVEVFNPWLNFHETWVSLTPCMSVPLGQNISVKAAANSVPEILPTPSTP